MRVELNSQFYICKEPLDWTYVDQISDVLRLEGTPVREDNPVISRIPYTWEKGLGWERMDRKTGSGVGGLAASRVGTPRPLAELALRLAREQLAVLEKTTPLDLAAAERTNKHADEDLKRYVDTGRPLAVKSARLSVNRSENYLKYAQEELRPLEKMSRT